MTRTAQYNQVVDYEEKNWVSRRVRISFVMHRQICAIAALSAFLAVADLSQITTCEALPTEGLTPTVDLIPPSSGGSFPAFRGPSNAIALQRTIFWNWQSSAERVRWNLEDLPADLANDLCFSVHIQRRWGIYQSMMIVSADSPLGKTCLRASRRFDDNASSGFSELFSALNASPIMTIRSMTTFGGTESSLLGRVGVEDLSALFTRMRTHAFEIGTTGFRAKSSPPNQRRRDVEFGPTRFANQLDHVGLLTYLMGINIDELANRNQVNTENHNG